MLSRSTLGVAPERMRVHEPLDGQLFEFVEDAYENQGGLHDATQEQQRRIRAALFQ